MCRAYAAESRQFARGEAFAAAEEDPRDAGAALAVEAQVADPRDLAGRDAARGEVGAQRREQRGTDYTVLERGIGGHQADTTGPVHGVAREADGPPVGIARRESRAEAAGPVELGHPVRELGRGEVVRAVAGLAFDRNPVRYVTAKPGVDRHVDADPVALEAERLEQHPRT